jgi:DNA-directed RNA polymerase
MKLELNLMELNSLYVAVSNQLKEAKLDASLYPSEFFQNQLIIAEELVEKVQSALHAECIQYDEVVEQYRMATGTIQFDKLDESYQSKLESLESDIELVDKIEALELDIELWEGERNHYASIGDWERCNQINSMIESWQEEVDTLKNEITK